MVDFRVILVDAQLDFFHTVVFDPRQADGLPTLRNVSGRLFCVQLSV